MGSWERFEASPTGDIPRMQSKSILKVIKTEAEDIHAYACRSIVFELRFWVQNR